jgi:hypothetical protein
MKKIFLIIKYGKFRRRVYREINIGIREINIRIGEIVLGVGTFASINFVRYEY